MNTSRPSSRPFVALSVVLTGLACLVAVGLGAGCSDAADASISLVVEHDFGVTFEDMATGVQHSNEPDAIVTTDDMRTEAVYKQLRPDLICMGLDRGNSFIKIDQLTKPGPDAPPFVYSIDIREVGETQWQLLAELNANIVNNQTHFFEDDTVTVIQAGTEKLETIGLSARPQYEVRFVGTANAPITDLSVEVHLEMKFSDKLSGCQ